MACWETDPERDAWRFIMQATQNKAFTHQAQLHHYPMGVIVQYILLSVTVAIMQTIKPSRHVFALKPKKIVPLAIRENYSSFLNTNVNIITRIPTKPLSPSTKGHCVSWQVFSYDWTINYHAKNFVFFHLWFFNTLSSQLHNNIATFHQDNWLHNHLRSDYNDNDNNDNNDDDDDDDDD